MYPAFEEEKVVQVCIEITREAGHLSVNYLRKKREIMQKSLADFVTDADLAVEELIVQRISAEFPDHDFLTEERLSKDSGSKYVWVIDPIDGTVNYVAGIPIFCVSVALVVEQQSRIGVIYDPLRDELFVARFGCGASLNGAHISVAPRCNLGESTIATELVKPPNFDLTRYREVLSKLPYYVGNARLLGPCSMSLAYVACGRLDLLYVLHRNPWDVAAGALLVREAGGVVTGWNEKFRLFSQSAMIAGNSILVKQFSEDFCVQNPISKR